MDYRELPFWQDTYNFCKEIVTVARHTSRSDVPLYGMLDCAAGEVPVAIVMATLAQDDKELRAMLMRAFTNVQMIVRVLFMLALRDEIDLVDTCDFVRRCAGVQCDLLTFYREQCA